MDPEPGRIVNRPLSGVLEYFAKRKCLPHWTILAAVCNTGPATDRAGHRVMLMPATVVRVFDFRNKNDAADASNFDGLPMTKNRLLWRRRGSSFSQERLYSSIRL
jgi:hypothetical protein